MINLFNKILINKKRGFIFKFVGVFYRYAPNYLSWEDKTRIEEAMFTDYITKPLNSDGLFKLIDNSLNKKI